MAHTEIDTRAQRPWHRVEVGTDHDLTDVERTLAEHVERGTWLVLADERPIRASVIRDIALGRLAPTPDPHGIRVHGARIDGRIDLDHVTTTVRIELCACRLDEGLTAQGAQLTDLILVGSELTDPTEPPVNLLRLSADLVALDNSTVEAINRTGAAVLQNARIRNGLTCAGATLRNESGPALNGEGLQVDWNVLLHGEFTANGTGELGAVRLLGAHIGDQLNCTDATITNNTGPALCGDGLQIGQSLFMRGTFTATGADENGAIRLPRAHIEGQLDCTHATITNNTGPALCGDGLQIGQNMLLRGTATGTGRSGAVRLLGAHIGGQLDCTDATITNKTGPALSADRFRANQDVFLCGTFMGTSSLGTIRLPGAHIDGQLDFSYAIITNNNGPAVYATEACIDKEFFFDGRAIGGGDSVTADLREVEIKGLFHVMRDHLQHEVEPSRRMNVDGLRYGGLPQGVSTKDWLRLIREGTPDYAAQPYQQLANALRAAGHDSAARKVLIAQRKDQIHRRALTGRAERGWARFTGVTLGYGYQPWRALIGLFGAIVISAILAVTLGANGGLARKDAPAHSCSVVDRVGVGLDLGTPLIATGARDRCSATDSATGQALTVSGWVLRLLAWAFASLFIAGFTGAVRKT